MSDKSLRRDRRWVRLPIVALRGGYRVVRVLLTTALIVVVVSAVAVLGIGRALGYQNLFVRSGSMGKSAPTGSMVVTKPLTADQVKVGHVIYMQPHDGSPPIMHRVIEVTKLPTGKIEIRTKGDANNGDDPNPYELRETNYTPVFMIPKVGFALAKIRTPGGWYGFVMLPAVLFSAVTICKIWWTEDEDDEASAEDSTDDADMGQTALTQAGHSAAT